MDEQKLKNGMDDFALHPNYLLRVCGGPANFIACTSTGETNQHVLKSNQLFTSLTEIKKEYCKVIEGRVSGLDDKATSRKLLKLKRDIFNIRKINPQAIKSIAHIFDDDELPKIELAVSQINEYFELQEQLPNVYSQEHASVSEQFRSLWENENLQYALSYTNPNLFVDFNSIYENPDKKLKPKKRRQLESGLLRYASRCSLKTSPLSTFTPVYVGAWDESSGNSEISFKGGLDNHVNVKASLFQYLLHDSLSDYEKVKRNFSLTLNPSMRLIENKIHLRSVVNSIGGSGRTWGTGENISQFNISQVIQCVLMAFKKLGHQSATVDELVGSVIKLAPKLERPAIEKIIAQLIGAGMFIVECGSFDQSELLPWFRENIEKLDGVDHQTALQHLDQIESNLRAFSVDKPKDRVQQRRVIQAEIESLSGVLQSSLSSEFVNPTFFEDSYIVDDKGKVDKAILDPFMQGIETVVKMSPFFDVHQFLQSSFADYFIDRFGQNGECDEVGDFIAEFVELYGIGSALVNVDKSKLAPDSNITIQAKTTINDFIKFLVEAALSGDDSVNLAIDDIEEFLEKMPEQVRNRGASHSILGQFSSKDENLFVVNNVFSGHSGMLSRFLEVLNDDELQKVRDYLTDVSRDGNYSEIPGLFGFAANRHPKMADQEVAIPPFSPNWEESRKAALTNLRLVYDDATHRVFLKTEEGKLMDCFYHGFLMPLLLPKMHCALTMLNNNGVILFIIPLLRSGKFSSSEKIHIIPRVSINNVVLIRKSYLVSRELLPSPDLSDAKFYEAMRLYVKDNQLPVSGFIRVAPFDIHPGTDDIELHENVDFKNMKPFYVDFENPRLVQLLHISMKRSDFPIVISEALPDTQDQCLQYSGEDHVSEIHFEITKKPVSTMSNST